MELCLDPITLRKKECAAVASLGIDYKTQPVHQRTHSFNIAYTPGT
jgi:hypothetical protein